MNLEERIVRLETENRRLKFAAMSTIVLIVVIVAMGAARTFCGSVTQTAQRFVLIDEWGKKRAVLEIQNGEPRFSMYNRQRKEAIRLAIEPTVEELTDADDETVNGLAEPASEARLSLTGMNGTMTESQTWLSAGTIASPSYLGMIREDPIGQHRRRVVLATGNTETKPLMIFAVEGEGSRVEIDANHEKSQITLRDENGVESFKAVN